MPEEQRKQVGRYRLVERIGAGGMGEVYLADLLGAGGFRRLCALKMTLPHRSARDDVKRMFEREASLAARIAHENVVQVFDFGRDGDALYLVMEHVDGLSLRAILERRRRTGENLTIAEVSALVLDAARGLHAVHTLKDLQGKPAGVVHRDVTPDNILVTREGVAKIGDFGIAVASDTTRLTMTGEIKGKVPYMSPEQLDGVDVTGAADIFALGVTLTWLITGKRPFDRATDLATMNAIVREDPPPLADARSGVPDALEQLVRRMLAKDPRARPSALQVADVLADIPGARSRPRALVDELLGPRAGVVPLGAPPARDTQVVRLRDALASTQEGTEATVVTSEPPAAAAITVATSTHVRQAPSRRRPVAVALGAALGLGAIGAIAVAVTRTPSAPVVAAVVTPAPSTSTPPAAAATGDAGVVVDPPVEVAPVDDPTPAVHADAAHAEPSVELRGPASVAWFSSDGKKLGAGTLKIHSRAHVVTAIDAATGAHCSVPVTSGLARFDTIPTGALDVRANPYAQVIVGTRDLGTTPLRPLPQLPACAYRVKLVYEKTTRTEPVRVVAGKTTSVRVDME